VIIAELADRIAQQVRENKEHHLGTLHDPNDRTDVRNTVHGFRGEDPVVLLVPNQTDRDKTLVAARVAAVAFGCDTIAFTAESWHPAKEHMDRQPVHRRPWSEKGSHMQIAADEHDALAKGVIIECLSTTVVNRAGDMVLVVQDYEILRHRNALGIVSYGIEWHEPQVLDSRTTGARLEGIIPEALVGFMNEPTLQHTMAKVGLTGQDFGLTEVETQAHQDCATVKFLLRQVGFEGALLLMSDNDKRTEIIDRSLGDAAGITLVKPEDDPDAR
jgi:hypothetical protein